MHTGRIDMIRRSKILTRTAILVLLLSTSEPLAAQAYPGHHNPSQVTGPRFVIGREGGNIRPFTVTIAADGTVTTTGAIQPASQHVKLGPDTLKGLTKLAKAEGFFSLPNTVSGSKVLPDVASLYITVRTSTVAKTVKQHGGKNHAFSELYAVLMAAAGTCDGFAQAC
jgi:hypothetical protein